MTDNNDTYPADAVNQAWDTGVINAVWIGDITYLRTTSPAACSRPPASDPNCYTLDWDEPYTVLVVELSLWIIVGLLLFVGAVLLARAGRRAEAAVALGVLVALVVWLIAVG